MNYRTWILVAAILISRMGIGSEASFYALSSLYYHLDTLCASSSEVEEDQIPLEIGDVADLWTSVIEEPTPELELAYRDYCQEAYVSAKDRIGAIWRATAQTNLDENPHLDRLAKVRMRPYLLPKKHHLHSILNGIFSRSRVIFSDETLAQAGFRTLCTQPFSHIRVASHPQLSGYLVKVYLDCDNVTRKDRPGYEWLTDRCIGADLIRKLIKKKKMRHFTVPDKWLYPVPSTAPEHVQPVILVVQDMHLVSKAETVHAWKTVITREHLDELYCILSHGLSSCFLEGNIPYTRNGTFSCIDTEYYDRKLKYHKVKPYLSDEMNLYWDELVRKGKSKKR